MITDFLRRIKKLIHKSRRGLDPDEIFLDSSNLPNYNTDQFEGRIEKPISSRMVSFVAVFFIMVVIIFLGKSGMVQIRDGSYYEKKSLNNNLRRDVIFADRGIITDRNGVELAWNEISENPFPKRQYINEPGFSNLLGFIKYPQKDSSGFFYTIKESGQDGIEKYFNDKLSGENGVRLTEVNAHGDIESQSIVDPSINGETIALSIDAGLQKSMYNAILRAVEVSGFVGGAGVFMDVKTGEVLSLVTYPSYDSNALTEGVDTTYINSVFSSKRTPSLDRAISGLYAPGSTIKPYIALGALNENTISPDKNIYSAGFISLPNPYNPQNPSIFKDWKAHGYTDMREALAVSSDVYFYAVGGGYQDQKGLGIAKIDEYLKKFMFAVPTRGFFAGPTGTIPTPEWKKENFADGEWRVGDTYHTTIGQYGFQSTPLQMARSLSGIVNNGVIVSPTILKDEQGEINKIAGIKDEAYKVVKEGMRQAVISGTAIALNIPGVTVAGKTGTSEIGSTKTYVNSWIEGYVPYEDPKYVFVLVLEKGPGSYEISSMRAMAEVLEWAKQNAPQYVGLSGAVAKKL